MTTNDVAAGENHERLQENLNRVEELSQRLVNAVTRRPNLPSSLTGPDQMLYANAAQTYWQEMMQNPAKLLETQIAYWGKSLTHFIEA